MVTPRGAINRTKLMEVAWRGGVDKKQILSYYPKVTTIGFNFQNRTDDGAFSAPFDDFAIAVDGVFILDLQRTGPETKKPEVHTPTSNAPIYVGAWVQVFTYDSRAYNTTHCRWTMDISYDDGISLKIIGGANDRWGDAYGEFERVTYYQNGHFILPPPSNWPRPKFFSTGLHAPTYSTRYDAKPTPNPLY